MNKLKKRFEVFAALVEIEDKDEDEEDKEIEAEKSS